MPGPPPKPASERRRANAPMANTLQLPAEGRKGRTPRFPGPGTLDANGRKIWRELWRTPMAVAWERFSWDRVVARYVATLVAAERALDEGEPSAALLGEVRQLEDRLGLTPMALLRLRWEIVADDLEEARDAAKRPARARLKAVSGAVARP